MLLLELHFVVSNVFQPYQILDQLISDQSDDELSGAKVRKLEPSKEEQLLQLEILKLKDKHVDEVPADFTLMCTGLRAMGSYAAPT